MARKEKNQIIKKGNLYYPSETMKERSWVHNEAVYREAQRDPLAFWEERAQELVWQKPWKKVFAQGKAPRFSWFQKGKLNITENCLDRHLKENKNKVAFIWEPENPEEPVQYITYYELSRRVNRFANALKKLGVKKGDRVGIYLPMIPEVTVAMLACARIGAIHSVVFSAFSPQSLRVRLQDTGAKVLVTADGYYRRGKLVNLKKNADQGVKDTKVQKVIVVKRAGKKVSFSKSRDVWYHDIVQEQSDVCPAVTMDAEDPLFILYTSGSTGKPKGCVHVCGGYMVQAYMTGKWIFNWRDETIFWSTADIGWITGHTYSCYGNLLNGVTTVLFEGAPDWPTPSRWAETIEKHGVTAFYTAPTAIRMFEKVMGHDMKRFAFKTLEILGSVGEPIDEASWNWYFEHVGKKRCPIVDTWWQTETGGVLITSLPGIGPFRPTYAGLPLPGFSFDIVDEKGESQAANREGNLVLLPPFAPSLVRAVYKNPSKYWDTYWDQYKGKMYFTSDGAFRDKKGLVRIVGRMDDVIKVAGHRITTGELENAMTKHKSVVECAVVGIPDEIRGEVPAAFVVVKKGFPKSRVSKEIIKEIRKEIGPIALPKKIYVVKDLPKTRSGKIMRRIIKKILLKDKNIGDLSTLANPESVSSLRKEIT